MVEVYVLQSYSNRPEWAAAVTSRRGILMQELLPRFLKHSKGNAVGWLNLIVAATATVIILWQNLYDTV